MADRRIEFYGKLGTGLSWVLLIALLLVISFPIVWMILTSLKTNAEVIAIPPRFFPSQPTLENFILLWREQDFLRYFCNSLIVACTTTTICVITSSMAGYVFSRFKSRWSEVLLMVILLTQMLPVILLLIGLFSLMRLVGLLNSYYALVISNTAFILPFCIWMGKNFFDTIPPELDEAAMLDGCSRHQVFIKIVLPLARPGLVATAIFAFITTWNEYMIALTLTSTDSMRTLPVAITKLIGQYATRWNRLMAASLIISLPAIAIFLILQRSFIQGLTGGAVKE